MEILFRIALLLSIKLGKTDILTTLSLLICAHELSLHLFSTTSINSSELHGFGHIDFVHILAYLYLTCQRGETLKKMQDGASLSQALYTNTKFHT